MDGKTYILLKGASEIVLESCSNWMKSSSGEIESIDPSVLEEMKTSI